MAKLTSNGTELVRVEKRQERAGDPRIASVTMFSFRSNGWVLRKTKSTWRNARGEYETDSGHWTRAYQLPLEGRKPTMADIPINDYVSTGYKVTRKSAGVMQ